MEKKEKKLKDKQKEEGKIRDTETALVSPTI